MERGCCNTVPVPGPAQPVYIYPVNFFHMYQAEPVRDHHLTAMGAVRDFGFNRGRSRFRLYDHCLSVLDPNLLGVGGVDPHGASPSPLVPGGIAHVRVGYHVHVVAGHENHRVFLVDQ